MEAAVVRLREWCEPGYTIAPAHGAPFTKAHTYLRPGGGRHCRRCGAEAAARKRDEKTAAACAIPSCSWPLILLGAVDGPAPGGPPGAAVPTGV
jgi:hypothetical protein